MKNTNEMNQDVELNEAELEEVSGGATRRSVTSSTLFGVSSGGSTAQTENGSKTRKLYKIGYDGGEDEDWGPVITSGR